MPKYDYITYQDKLYYIYRKININQVKEQYIKDLKEIFLCDIVIKYTNQADNSLLFLREIPEAEIVS